MDIKNISDNLRFEDVTVQLTGEDGNAFGIIARCKKAITRAHGVEAGKRWSDAAMTSGSYNELLAFCMETVDVE